MRDILEVKLYIIIVILLNDSRETETNTLAKF